jgi:beta-N-acetylhexosaminidase
VELKPFRSAIAAGTDAIMTAHVQFPAYDGSGSPATLSPVILDGLLRVELGYEGVIVTDCLEMKAISETVGIGRGAVMAIQAGADLVLVSHRLDRQIEALEALYQAVLSGEISEARIDLSVQRLLAAKRKRALVRQSQPGVVPGAAAHKELALQVCRKSVTLVKNMEGALPLKPEVPTLAVWPVVRTSSEVDEVIDQELTLGGALAQVLTDVREVVIGTDPGEGEIASVLVQAAGCTQIVVGTYNAAFSPGQIRLVKELLKLEGVKVIAVSLRNPYDLQAFPDVHAYAACYENRPQMLQALAEVLTGRTPASGCLPVTLSEDYPVGYGL